jgi:hypothetical protein
MCECVYVRVCMCVHARHRQQGEHSTEKHHVCTVHHTAVVSGVCTRLLSARGRVLAIRGTAAAGDVPFAIVNVTSLMRVSCRSRVGGCWLACGSGSGSVLQTRLGQTRTLLCTRFKHFVLMTKLMSADQFIEWHAMTTRRRCILIRGLC